MVNKTLSSQLFHFIFQSTSAQGARHWILTKKKKTGGATQTPPDVFSKVKHYSNNKS
ncbi:hypothetical protein SAMN04488057_105249 [Cyclobacterium lianum]|uniref:Uncharacterized protein n=1 Tax=Cyclobacterium lianum TaxID=388280 RepID=A0A1M7NEB5_9BACT|nr:hypothetical protein SAMN04488057_105249 [Cyclobacterium lianum]